MTSVGSESVWEGQIMRTMTTTTMATRTMTTSMRVHKAAVLQKQLGPKVRSRVGLVEKKMCFEAERPVARNMCATACQQAYADSV